jgi:hypothetical protein
MNIFSHLADNRRRSSWQRALVLTLCLRVAYSVFGAVAALIQPVNWQLIHSNALTDHLPLPDHSLRYLLFGVWERFDTLWYLHIAGQGYDRPAVVFFPLYPSLIKMTSLLMPPMAAAMFISALAAFFSFWGLQELLASPVGPAESDLTKPNLANQSVLLCAVWPASFIFFAGYSESLLFALVLWSLVKARRNHWLTAIALGAAAALTKAVGGVVVVPLLIMAIRQRKGMALPALLIPLTSVGFMAYLHWSGRGTLSSAYAQYWQTSTSPPWTTLWISIQTLAHTPNPILVANFIFLIAACALAVLSRLKMEYVFYAAVAVLAFLCKATNPPLQSIVRYLLIIFPAYAGLARVFERPHLRSRFGMLCAALFLLNLGLLWLFLGWSLVL